MKLIDQLLDSNVIVFIERLETLYNRLCELELAGKKNSKEYNEYIELCKELNEIIRRKMDKFTFDNDELIMLEDNLAKLNNLDGKDLIEEILSGRSENKISRLLLEISRLGARKNVYIFGDVDEDGNLIKMDENEFADDLETYKEEIEEANKEEYKYNMEISEIEDMISKILDATLIDYIDKAIDNEKNEKFKEYYIRVKYRLIFLFEYVEKAFLKDPNHYSMSYLYSELFRVTRKKSKEEFYYEEYLNPIATNVQCYLEVLSKMNDETDEDEYSQAKLKLFILYIKSYVSMIYDEKVLKDVKKIKTNMKKETTSIKSKKLMDEAFRTKF